MLEGSEREAELELRLEGKEEAIERLRRIHQEEKEAFVSYDTSRITQVT